MPSRSGREALFLAAAAVEGDGEAVGLVADGLDEAQGGGGPVEADPVAGRGREQDLLFLGDGHEGEVGQA